MAAPEMQVDVMIGKDKETREPGWALKGDNGHKIEISFFQLQGYKIHIGSFY